MKINGWDTTISHYDGHSAFIKVQHGEFTYEFLFEHKCEIDPETLEIESASLVDPETVKVTCFGEFYEMNGLILDELALRYKDFKSEILDILNEKALVLEQEEIDQINSLRRM